MRIAAPPAANRYGRSEFFRDGVFLRSGRPQPSQ